MGVLGIGALAVAEGVLMWTGWALAGCCTVAVICQGKKGGEARKQCLKTKHIKLYVLYVVLGAQLVTAHVLLSFRFASLLQNKCVHL